MGWMLMWYSAQSNGGEAPIKRALRRRSLKWNFNESSLLDAETNQMKSSLTMRASRRRFCRLVGPMRRGSVLHQHKGCLVERSICLLFDWCALFVFYRKPIHARAAWGIPLYNICWANACTWIHGFITLSDWITLYRLYIYTNIIQSAGRNERG